MGLKTLLEGCSGVFSTSVFLKNLTQPDAFRFLGSLNYCLEIYILILCVVVVVV